MSLFRLQQVNDYAIHYTDHITLLKRESVDTLEYIDKKKKGKPWSEYTDGLSCSDCWVKKFSRWHFEIFFLFFSGKKKGPWHFMQIVSFPRHLNNECPQDIFLWRIKENIMWILLLILSNGYGIHDTQPYIKSPDKTWADIQADLGLQCLCMSHDIVLLGVV